MIDNVKYIVVRFAMWACAVYRVPRKLKSGKRGLSYVRRFAGNRSSNRGFRAYRAIFELG